MSKAPFHHPSGRGSLYQGKARASLKGKTNASSPRGGKDVSPISEQGRGSIITSRRWEERLEVKENLSYSMGGGGASCHSLVREG